MNRKFIQEFENMLKQVLDYDSSCEGEIGNIKIRKDTDIITRMGMSKGLIGYLYVHVPEKIKLEDIKLLLRKNEKIETGYTKFTPKKVDVQSFYVTRIFKHGWENILIINRNNFSTFVKEKNGKEYINKRALKIIEDYLKEKIKSF
jgi:hypothetical protein